MSRSFYSYAIFFTILFIVASLFQTIIIYFQSGPRVHELQSLTAWLISSYLIAFTWSLILLKYYYYKGYRLTFWALIISIGASFWQFIALLDLLRIREITMYYLIATSLALVVGILYSMSLIFSVAGERFWLKAAGVFQALVALVSMLSIILAMTSPGSLLNGTISKIEQWTSLIAGVGPVLFIVNFWIERKRSESADTSRDPVAVLSGFVALVAVVATLFVGQKIFLESLRLSVNPGGVSQNLKTLADAFEPRVYVNSDGDSLLYRLLIPVDYDSTKRYPLVVCLHGSSGCGRDNVKQVATSFPAWLLSNEENRKKYPAFLFVPQCPLLAGWGGIPGLPSVDSLVFETILALDKEFPVDTKRRYVSGNSLGGYGTWHFISTRPEMFAAAIPISGGGDPKRFRNIVDVPVWAFHGEKDINVRVSGSRDIIAAMEEAGGEPRYTEFPGAGHHIWNNVTETPGLLDWLFAQRRK